MSRLPAQNDAIWKARTLTSERRLSTIRPVVRRGLSRQEAATYLGISPSKFDELRKANRIAPPKVLDGRLIFTVERLDEFLDSLPDENQTSNDDWTASL
jgi:Helix-turn-helix domain